MINPFTEINWHPDTPAIRRFGRTLIVGFAVIGVLVGALGWWRESAGAGLRAGLVVLAAGGGAGLLAVLLPVVARPLYYVWYAVAAAIGLVVSNVLLVAFFYLFFTPFTLALRLVTRRDPLRRRRPKDAASHWVQAKPRPPAASYRRQY